MEKYEYVHTIHSHSHMHTHTRTIHTYLHIHTLALQQVDNPALSIMVPLLIRGLRSNETPIKRKTAIIIANMSKLVNNPADATVFLPR